MPLTTLAPKDRGQTGTMSPGGDEVVSEEQLRNKQILLATTSLRHQGRDISRPYGEEDVLFRNLQFLRC